MILSIIDLIGKAAQIYFWILFQKASYYSELDTLYILNIIYLNFECKTWININITIFFSTHGFFNLLPKADSYLIQSYFTNGTRWLTPLFLLRRLSTQDYPSYLETTFYIKTSKFFIEVECCFLQTLISLVRLFLISRSTLWRSLNMILSTLSLIGKSRINLVLRLSKKNHTN